MPDRHSSFDLSLRAVSASPLTLLLLSLDVDKLVTHDSWPVDHSVLDVIRKHCDDGIPIALTKEQRRLLEAALNKSALQSRFRWLNPADSGYSPLDLTVGMRVDPHVIMIVRAMRAFDSRHESAHPTAQSLERVVAVNFETRHTLLPALAQTRDLLPTGEAQLHIDAMIKHLHDQLDNTFWGRSSNLSSHAALTT